MIPFIGPIIDLVGNIFGGVNDHFKGKRELKKAELNTRMRIMEAKATHDIDWEKLWAAQAAESWKDEWWTMVVSIPLVMVFVPAMVPHVQAGFAALDTLPEFYKWMVMTAFGASFGVRIVPKLKGMLK
jgi:hypothetical protein